MWRHFFNYLINKTFFHFFSFNIRRLIKDGTPAIQSCRLELLTYNNINDNLQQLSTAFYDFYFSKRSPNDELSKILLSRQKSTIQANQMDGINGEYPFFTSGEAVNESNTYLTDGLNCYMSTGGVATIKAYFGRASYSTDTWCVYGLGDYSTYLFFYLKSIITSINNFFFAGSGLKHLQKEALLKTRLYIPTETEIKTFNKQVGPLLKKSSSLMIENRRLNKLRDFLLPLLMNGQATIAD